MDFGPPPVFALEEGMRPIFAPIQQARAASGNSWLTAFIILFFGGVVVAILLHVRIRKMEAKRYRERRWKRTREICIERGLAEGETESVIQAIRALDPTEPDRGVTSEAYFHSMVAPELRKRIPQAGCEHIQSILFPHAEEESVADEGIGGTRELKLGQKIRLHFEGVSGTFACTIINVREDSFIVTLPPAVADSVQVHENQAVEGFMHMGNNFYSFQSKVLEAFATSVLACRIAHTTALEQTHRRRYTRVAVTQTVVFSHLSAADVEQAEVDFADLRNKTAEQRRGVLRDVSVGGCSIATPSRHVFDVGDFAQFVFRVLEDEDPHTVMAQIVHISPMPRKEGTGVLIHLQFLGLEEEAQAAVARTVHHLLREGEEPDV